MKLNIQRILEYGALGVGIGLGHGVKLELPSREYYSEDEDWSAWSD